MKASIPAHIQSGLKEPPMTIGSKGICYRAEQLQHLVWSFGLQKTTTKKSSLQKPE